MKINFPVLRHILPLLFVLLATTRVFPAAAFIPGFEKENSIKEVPFSKLFTQMFTGREMISYENVRFVNDLNDLYKANDPVDPRTFLKQRLHLPDSAGYFKTTYLDFELKDCIFEDDIRFAKILFVGRWSAANCSMLFERENTVGNAFFTFDSCTVTSQFDVSEGDESQLALYTLTNCKIQNIWIEVYGQTILSFTNCRINGISKIELHETSTILFDNTTIGGNDMPNFQAFPRNDVSIVVDGNSILKMNQCLVQLPKGGVLNIEVNQGRIWLSNSDFNCLFNLHSEEMVKMTLRNNRFYRIFNPRLNNVSRLSEIAPDGIGHFYFYPFDSACFASGGLSDSLLADKEVFRNTVSSCKVFYDHYREMGNTEMANYIYARIQDIEYLRLRELYRTAPTFKHYFSLQLSRLLKFYTNYGTDPARALVISFYIILLFGLFYFFFPSDWDVSSKSMLLKNFRTFVEKNSDGYLKPFLFLIFGLFVSLLNAATLSLNSFTTLGFGNIPTNGLARYVCVLEGFLGWFLLSLFTVALINQAQF